MKVCLGTIQRKAHSLGAIVRTAYGPKDTIAVFGFPKEEIVQGENITNCTKFLIYIAKRCKSFEVSYGFVDNHYMRMVKVHLFNPVKIYQKE